MLPADAPPAHTAQNAHIASSDTSQYLKKTYLSLLPPVQIIEICLAFEPHVPLHVRNAVWPPDLDAAISSLKSRASAVLVVDSQGTSQSFEPLSGLPQEVHPPGPEWHAVGNGDPPMDSLIDPAIREDQTLPSKAASQEPIPAAPSPNLTASASASPAPAPVSVSTNVGQSSSFSISGPAVGDPHSTPTVGSSPPRPASLHPSVAQPPMSYPYTPYGYPYQAHPHTSAQSAYPHAPYYPSPPSAAHAYPPAYSYPGYPPPTGYPPVQSHAMHQPYAPGPHQPHPTGASTSTASSPAPPPQSTEDLPSYEEMIVEALLDGGDSEGAVPKELFAWMAARYPLQTNFRPSASQALQKAYKRGRLEKRAGGRYRVNPAWEGGATTKRTTRRPQTLAQTTYAMHHPPQPPSSPFTHAPLAHSHHSPYPAQTGSSAPGQVAQYPGYPYGYPASYPYPPPHGYQPYPPPPAGDTPAPDKAAAASTSTSHATPVASTAIPSSGTDKPTEEVSDEHNDLWEATQHILNAINFGVAQAAATPAENAAYPPPVIASAGIDPGSDTSPSSQRTMLTDEERSSLQTQLSLLASQLAEIADDDEEEEASEEGASGMNLTLDVNDPTDTHRGARIVAVSSGRGDGGNMGDVGVESDDDDMEMVEVPMLAGHEALRT
ncbi:hypothetical protein B0H21DRAFT_826490 [Amylocystis lapponica]|nr:hypothetical protein B0H21DRAFT_826490 [Amylocystis lapponica]